MLARKLEPSRVPDATPHRPTAPPQEVALLAASAAGDQAAFRSLTAMLIGNPASVFHALEHNNQEDQTNAE